ncbi:Hpt domain-containing protein [Pseudarthrobacter sp. RMG13]|uniref:Hpt domain-containing protein n=1 Tax=Pseudarthrobacter humi TaxID=2952523 RepID=A0ABT1LQ44_9MICC|nr:Hpt domain-containing protein [Pseudarthrobacter humi]
MQRAAHRLKGTAANLGADEAELDRVERELDQAPFPQA